MSDIKHPSFRGRHPTADDLEDLILVELAVRDQAGLDEERRPLAQARPPHEPVANVRAIAAAEGWLVDQPAIDEAVARLTQAHFLTTDRNPQEPGPHGCRARLSSVGLARAAARARDLLGEPLGASLDDPAFEGIGQVGVTFLGERFLIGCVEGEEDQAILHAHQFEVDAGEVLKAVSAELDYPRAMLMAGVLAHERIAELEESRSSIPASDRIVALDHNAPYYLAASSALEQLIDEVRESNSYRNSDPQDQERRLAELEAGQRLIKSRRVSASTIRAVLWGTLGYLATKFADAPIGEAATLAWNALKALIGL